MSDLRPYKLAELWNKSSRTMRQALLRQIDRMDIPVKEIFVILEARIFDLFERILERSALSFIEKNQLLYRSCEICWIQGAQLLVEVGADPNAAWSMVHDSDDREMSLLEKAIHNGDVGCVETLLLAGADVHWNGGIPIVVAASYGNAAIVKLLIDAGASVHARNGQSIIEAARHTQDRIVRYLLECGADVSAQDDAAICVAHRRSTIDILIEFGAKLDARSGETLYQAARRGDIIMVSHLLDRGANPLCGRGRALTIATSEGHLAVVKLLVRYYGNAIGVDASNALNAAGERAALDPIYATIKDYLLVHGAEFDPTCDLFIKESNVTRRQSNHLLPHQLEDRERLFYGMQNAFD